MADAAAGQRAVTKRYGSGKVANLLPKGKQIHWTSCWLGGTMLYERFRMEVQLDQSFERGAVAFIGLKGQPLAGAVPSQCPGRPLPM